MHAFPAWFAFIGIVCSLLAARVLRAMPFLMLVYALACHFLFANTTSTTGLQARFRRAFPAKLAVLAFLR